MTARNGLMRAIGRAALLPMMLCAVGGFAQSAASAPAAGDAPKPAAAETMVEGLTRKDATTIALGLPGGALLLHDFSFNGDAQATSKLHLRQTVPGVVEITSVAYTVGDWQFHVRDAGSYYGLGERADGLNHAHSVVNNVLAEGRGTAAGSSKPMPFYLSTTGYGLWLDTTSEAVFDLNQSSADDVVVRVQTARLRIVLFAGPGFAGILERFTKVAGRAALPPMWAFAPWKGRAGATMQEQAMEDVERTRELGLPASVILMDVPWIADGYSFDTKLFPDEAGMAKQMHAAGYKMVGGGCAVDWRRDGCVPAGGE